MPSVSSSVVGGDILSRPVTTTVTPAYETTGGSIGQDFDSKNASTVIRGYLARFELEIPAGSTITGVRINFVSSSITGTSFPFRIGFLATDGLWNAPTSSSGGFNATQYATHASLPWPVREDAFGVLEFRDSYWHDGAAGFDGFLTGLNAASGVAFSIGDSYSEDSTATGLVSHAQAFLDDATASDRANSVSGTALPFAFCIVPDDDSALADNLQGIRTHDNAIESNRPTLEVAYTEPNTPPTVGSITLQTAPPLALGDLLIASAGATDAQDGTLALDWSSDRDGVLETSSSTLRTTALSVGSHTITATATDSGGLTASSSIAVEVYASSVASSSRARDAVSNIPRARDGVATNASTRPAASSWGRVKE